MAILSYRSLALWMLGYPEAALADAERALRDAREIGQAATLMYALLPRIVDLILLRKLRDSKRASSMKLVALADEKGASFWKAYGNACKVGLLALTGKASDAVQMITSGIDCMAVNGSNSVDAVVSCHIWREPMRNSANSMTLGAASAKR